MSVTFSIGWDVGAWVSKKGDAIWILDSNAKTYCAPQHGNWGATIQQSPTASEFIERLFGLCNAQLPPDTRRVTLAIDAPLAFPAGFVNLIAENSTSPEPLCKAIDNPYLFRRTETFASKKRTQNRNPLSPIQDQIGSQATKVAHVLRKFQFANNQNGTWCAPSESGVEIRVIEAYPAMSKRSQNGDILPGALKNLFDEVKKLHEPATNDESDALICALVAHLHTHSPDELYPPENEHFLPEEGWIWFPRHELSSKKS